MAISDEITRLQNAKAALKTSIEGKGVTVSSDATLDDYPALVDSIEAGGSGGSGGATDDWLYLQLNDVEVTGTMKTSLNYSNTSNLTVERLASSGDYACDAYNWSTSKIIMDGPGGDGSKVWFRIKPNNMSIDEIGSLIVVSKYKKQTFTFQLIETFSDNQSYHDGCDIERLTIIGIEEETTIGPPIK